MSTKLTFGKFIAYSDVSELLTEDILAFLEGIQPLCDKDVKVVAQLSSGEIAQLISVSKPELKRKSISIAIEILSRLKAAGYKEDSRAVSEPQQPQELVIKPGLEQMGLSDLLKVCKDESGKKPEAWRLLTTRTEYIDASKKTPTLGWVVNEELDVERTVNYIYQMSAPLTVKQTPSREKGERLIPLAEALGIETRSYVHPLSGKLLRGPDQYGIDWPQELSPEYHQAALWALVDPNCHIHPGDSYHNAQELLKGQGVWSLIMAQYWQALDENNSSAMSVSIYGNTRGETQTSPATQLGNVQEFQPKSVKNSESIVRYHARDKHVVFHSSQTVEGIYNQLEVVGSCVHLRNVVVLEGANLIGRNISGTIITPSQGISVRSIGLNIDVAKKIWPWEEIAQQYNLK